MNIWQLMGLEDKMTQFKDKWLEAVEKKNSVLCAGLDPAEFGMGRGEKGLPNLTDKRDWSLKYIEAVAPFVAAVKPNAQYWVDQSIDPKVRANDMKTLVEIGQLVHENGAVYILDAKLADIGSTNDAGIYHHNKKGFDAVTVAPYAGNMAEIGKQAKERGIGTITMCLMSNPDYQKEKDMLVPLSEEERDPYRGMDIEFSNDFVPHVKRYKFLANSAKSFGLDGIVIGAPSETNHIKEEELETARYYAGEDMLVLLPGVGEQGGEAGIIWKYFNPKNVMVNVGRSGMFPKGSNSTPQEQAEAAKYYRDMLNRLRA